MRGVSLRVADLDLGELVNLPNTDGAEDVGATELCAFLGASGIRARVEPDGETVTFRVATATAASDALFGCACYVAAARYLGEAERWAREAGRRCNRIE